MTVEHTNGGLISALSVLVMFAEAGGSVLAFPTFLFPFVPALWPLLLRGIGLAVRTGFPVVTRDVICRMMPLFAAPDGGFRSFGIASPSAFAGVRQVGPASGRRLIIYAGRRLFGLQTARIGVFVHGSDYHIPRLSFTVGEGRW